MTTEPQIRLSDVLDVELAHHSAENDHNIVERDGVWQCEQCGPTPRRSTTVADTARLVARIAELCTAWRARADEAAAAGLHVRCGTFRTAATELEALVTATEPGQEATDDEQPLETIRSYGCDCTDEYRHARLRRAGTHPPPTGLQRATEPVNIGGADLFGAIEGRGLVAGTATPADQPERCSTCGDTMDTQGCSKSPGDNRPRAEAGFHTASGGVGAVPAPADQGEKP